MLSSTVPIPLEEVNPKSHFNPLAKMTEGKEE